MTRLPRSLLFVSLLTWSCASQPPEEAKAPKANLDPPTLSELLPLKDRTVSSFETSSDLGDKGLLVLEIFRPRPEVAELRIAGRTQRLRVEATKVSHAAGGVLLEEPLEVGHQFRGSFGETSITEVNTTVTLPAGELKGCLVTVEESTRPPKRATSTYCRGVGLSKMVIEVFGGEGAGRLETRLTDHAPRVDFREQ